MNIEHLQILVHLCFRNMAPHLFTQMYTRRMLADTLRTIELDSWATHQSVNTI